MRLLRSVQHRLPFDHLESPIPPAEHLDSRARGRASVTPELAPREAGAPLSPPLSPRVSPPVSPPASAAPVEYVRHPRARRYLLRVRLDGSVRATIPRGGSKREAVRFVEAHSAWIADQQRAAAGARAARRPTLSPEERIAMRRRAAAELPPRLQALAEQFGLTVRKVSVRDQRWRWGSCSRQGHICVNWRLIQMPEWVRDYVLIHELMHLHRMDHSPTFWAHVGRACPDYQRARAWLREHGRGLTDE